MTKKFYQLSARERLEAMGLTPSLTAFYRERQSDEMPNLIENYFADFTLPEGLLRHLVVDGRSYQVPMVTEEPSVVAAANNGARLVGQAGGFQSHQTSQSLLGGQILFQDVAIDELSAYVSEQREAIFEAAKLAKPSMVERGDGLKDVQIRPLAGRRASLDLTVQTGEAMGANAVNTILEAVKAVFQPFNKNIVAAILTNAGHDALVTVTAQMPVSLVGGLAAAKAIESLSAFGKVDPDRAVTENKGIFNGLSAVVLATGNDYRAVEAAGHAYAGSTGRYQSLSTWKLDDTGEFLLGSLTMPVNIGRLGGAIAAMPMAQRNLELLGAPSLDALKKVIVATGLANNLAALKAVSGPGIQAGHMRMQARTLAIQVGAVGDEVLKVANGLAAEGAVDQNHAKKILGEIRKNDA